MERKNIKNENQQIKLQKAPLKPNVMKVPNSNNGSPQKRMIKIDLKLQYLLNQLNSTRKFKDFLDELNMTAKEVIQNAYQNYQQKVKLEKKKNSFNLVSKLGQEKVSQETQQKSVKEDLVSKQQQKIKSSVSKSKSLSQKIDAQKLQQIKEMILNKKIQILNHIQLIKKRMANSSIWDDKYFYDFTESNYQQKMSQVQQKLKITQENLQQKQKQKKELNTNPSNLIKRTKSIKYSCYEQNSQEIQIADQNYQVKRKIMTQIKRINQLQHKLSSVLSQKKQNSYQSLNEQFISQQNQINKQKSQQKQNQHPFLKSIRTIKKEMKKISAQISVKKKIRSQSELKIQSSQPSQNKPNILTKLIQLFNKQIIYQELSKTKRKISQLKYQTSTLQIGIKELQGFKALMILRNKNIQNLNINNKKLYPSGKNNYDDQILKQILQHQFLNKSLSLKIQTKFCCLKKKDVHSKTDIDLKNEMNYFPNINKFKKCLSQQKLTNPTKILSSELKENQERSPPKTNKKLQITGSKSSKKKQIGSSAETNP